VIKGTFCIPSAAANAMKAIAVAAAPMSESGTARAGLGQFGRLLWKTNEAGVD
jgi:hypothetical protein